MTYVVIGALRVNPYHAGPFFAGYFDVRVLHSSIFFKPLICKIPVRPNVKIPVFRVTQPYLNLLVKPRIFFRFLE